MSTRPDSGPRQRGFTLVELLIVVVILAILAAVVIPQMNSEADEARRTQFVQSLLTIATAGQSANALNGYHLEDASCGNLPLELQPFLKANDWAKATPLGGRWDSEQNLQGVASAVGVHFHGGSAPPDSEMVEVDEMFDDGSLTTGAFRKLGDNRFYFVLAD